MSDAIDLKRLVDQAYNTGFKAGLQSIIDVIDIGFTQPVQGEYLKDSLLYVYIKQQLEMMGPDISDRNLDITMALLKEVKRGA